MQNLIRRGFNLGQAPLPNPSQDQDNNPGEEWIQGKPIKIRDVCKSSIAAHQNDIENTESLVIEILEGNSIEETILSEPFSLRLTQRFEALGAANNEGDDQEVETLYFDAVQNEKTIAEDLWLKVSWLSYHEEDASIRFRFSFGVDLEEDVASDPVRQSAAAELAEAIFPECAIISQNGALLEFLEQELDIKKPNFVERIMYFNAPNGGAYLHHDLERGHAGVVYAQLSGATLWLALPHQALATEVASFLQSHELPASLNNNQRQSVLELGHDQASISQALNSFSHDGLIHLINETEEFVQFLIAAGHYRVLGAGDVILLPQKDSESCCWHSVFCLGDEIGQSLSFAVKDGD